MKSGVTIYAQRTPRNGVLYRSEAVSVGVRPGRYKMDGKDVTERLVSLMWLDHDAVLAYKRGIDLVHSPVLKVALQRFREDHQRHLVDLGTAITREGGKRPALSREAKGVFLGGMTAVESTSGESEVLAACETGEKYVNYKYSQAAYDDFPLHIKRLIERNYRDEKRHLLYMQERLRTVPKRLTLAGKLGLGMLGVAAGAVLWCRIIGRS